MTQPSFLPPTARIRVYLAGPMSGIQDFNYPAFLAKAAELRGYGYDVSSPAELSGGITDLPWEYYMRVGIQALLECDQVYCLPGSRESRGASLEIAIATALKLPILFQETPDRTTTQ